MTTSNRSQLATLAAFVLSVALPCGALTQGSFVNWEHPHVHPLELTPSGVRLLAVNTADNRLEVFDASGGTLVPLWPIDVGVDPVSVRARNDTEAWVVNHVSDSISIVDLGTGELKWTLPTADEPADVVFAGTPLRAFVTCSQANLVQVFDPSNLALPPVEIALDAEEPRALAVSPGSDRVYVAIFESGNGTTVLGGDKVEETVPAGTLFPPNIVGEPFTPYGGQNPPPNSGSSFFPAQNPINPPPPRVSHVVKKDDQGRWMDDNGADWTQWVSGNDAPLSGRIVGWDVNDYDLAVIETSDLSVSYVRRLMNVDMALAVNPVDGRVTVVGTDAINEVRFEPNLTGIFLRVLAAFVDVDQAASSVVDMNAGHLDYSVGTLPQTERDKSIGDPRGIAWNAAGTRAYVTGMGSNNLIVLDSTGARVGLAPTIEVGEGPTGVVLHESAGRAYVLNKFEASISVVDLQSELETARVDFFDPSPLAIKLGRKHLYDTHKGSGLGHVSCGSCHVDSRLDRLVWDLGDPGGEMKSIAGQNLAAGLPVFSYETFEDWHPMKGPLQTQTLQDIIGKEPFHWRGDKFGIEDFNGAFVSLQGDDAVLSPTEMQEFEDFLATITFAPNPNRNFDNSLPTALDVSDHLATGRFHLPAGTPLPPGNAEIGLLRFRPPVLLSNNKACATCHTLPTGFGTDHTWDGTAFVPLPLGPLGESHTMLTASQTQAAHTVRVAPLRNVFERTGLSYNRVNNRSGVGIRHDGTIDAVERTISNPIFTGIDSDQDVANLVAFLMSFSGSELPLSDGTKPLEPPGPLSKDTHAGVGRQVTIESLATTSPEQLATIQTMQAMADQGRVGVVAKGRRAGEERGFTYVGADLWQSDRASELVSTAMLQSGATPQEKMVFVLVPLGTELRVGIDRDEDGFLDRDELDVAADPADPLSTPGACVAAIPAAPVNLAASSPDKFQIRLTWNDLAADETFYEVGRSVAGVGKFDLIARLPADTTSFTDIGLLCGQPYDYRVAARNCAGAAAATIAAVTDGCQSLVGDVAQLSLASGGTQNLALEAGPTLAGAIYLVLGSLSGTAPGFSLDGVVLPLNGDDYFQLTLLSASGPPIVNSLGVLDDSGRGTADLVLPAGSAPTLVGTTAHHAFLVIDPASAAVRFASNAESVSLVP
ncbi:YncE family protein [Engelhardtia mirabilis]|uniref:Lactonase, 7-bladed beta-propeller n=1 Tax=Engelhardtia mirabilis TaxID=2528011 RepID=A0A518BKI2_9BACT|nr:hypothetical protein Pla133_25670 [Planctomycetes bacterium Pla133]QDV01810.1 hypothetical protein Pla86_25660 [Planctomycetes bacterium Pla86]